MRQPVFELPKALGFQAALENVPTVISLCHLPSMKPRWLPITSSWTITALESEAQRNRRHTGQPYSPARTVGAPFYNTKIYGGCLGWPLPTLPFKDEVEYLQNQVAPLVEADGRVLARLICPPSGRALPAVWRGWWKNDLALGAPNPADVPLNLSRGELTV